MFAGRGEMQRNILDAGSECVNELNCQADRLIKTADLDFT